MIAISAGNMEKKKKLLISSFCYAKGRGSEPSIGWEISQRLSEFYDVTVIADYTYEKHQAERSLGGPRVLYHSVDSLKWMRKKSGPIWFALYYNQWQKSLASFVRNAEVDCDIALHLTVGRYHTPSSLWKLGVPFVLGPVGGGETVPWKLYKPYSLKNKLIELLRVISMRWAGFGASRNTLRNANAVIATTRETQNRVEQLDLKAEINIEQAAGISSQECDSLAPKTENSSSQQFNILCVTRLVYWKGVDLLIEALEFVTEDCHLTIVGSGPEGKRLKALAKLKNLENKITFVSHVPREQVLRMYAEADCFSLPSLHDSGGFVFMEAMAAGLPVVCLDTGGPGVIVGKGCGVKVPITNRDEIIRQLSEGIQLLAEDTTLSISMRNASIQKVREFEWDKKVQKIKQIIEDTSQ